MGRWYKPQEFLKKVYLPCDSCMFSRDIVSENGFHSVCCLSDEKARECLISGKHYVMHPKFKDTDKDGES